MMEALARLRLTVRRAVVAEPGRSGISGAQDPTDVDTTDEGRLTYGIPNNRLAYKVLAS